MYLVQLQHDAAAKLQALQRGRLGRQAAVEVAALQRQQAEAAVRLQALQRGNKGREAAAFVAELAELRKLACGIGITNISL